jgi:hypothetical protein
MAQTGGSNIPTGAFVTRRIKERTLQRGNRPIEGTLAPAWDVRERILGSTAEGVTHVGGERTSKARN